MYLAITELHKVLELSLIHLPNRKVRQRKMPNTKVISASRDLFNI